MSNIQVDSQLLLEDYRDRSDFTDHYWKTSTPASQEVEENLLLQGLDYFYATNMEIHSLLIIRNNHIIFERYGHESSTNQQYNPSIPHLIHSCTKNIVSALIGIAISQGYFKNVKEPILPYFKDLELENLTEEKSQITIEDILTMRSGLTWGESDIEEYSFMNAPIPVKYVLDQKIRYTPGKVFNYSSGNIHILTALLHRTTGKTPLQFAIENLFLPLGIQDPTWIADSQGTNYGCFGISLTARDLSRITGLYLNKGNWKGKQIIPESWIKASLSAHSMSHWSKENFGYLWWLPNAMLFAARGAWGQNTYGLPHHNMIVTINANITFDTAGKNLEKFVQKYICQAAK